MIPLLQGTDPKKIVPRMKLAWLRDPEYRTNRRPVHWSGGILEPNEGTVDEFVQVVKEKNSPQDLAVWIDRETNMAVIAHVVFSEPEASAQ